MTRQELHADWTLTATASHDTIPPHIKNQRIAAIVPGCVHTDLLRAGLIDDPYIGLNEQKQLWIGETDWRYECTFDAAPGVLDQERIDLVFDGLDTIATISLNGKEVGRSINMHHAHRFDIRGVLQAKNNHLVVQFHSPNEYARQQEQRLGPLPYTNTKVPFNFIRKMACSFGWDWGPSTATSGIWRGVRVEAGMGPLFKQVRHEVTFENDDAILDCDVLVDEAFAHPQPVVLTLKITAPDGTHCESRDEADGHIPNRFGPTIRIRDARKWWPRGHGEQPLYGVRIELRDQAGSLLDEWSARIGLRTVELDTSPDDIGRRFAVKINGKEIFCKGFNWIPDDCFLDRACTPERYRTRIQQAVDSGANMLRVWGGGIFETKAFYDICDELGVMVWQDCLFACAAYPEEEPFRSSIEQEVRYNVNRLSPHPSLVLWNGCNENVWGYHDWGWRTAGKVKGRTWGPGYYFDLLPKIIEQLDPSRPYWAASPWSGDTDWENGLHPNLASHGNKHVWEVWSAPYEVYRNFTPRFCSEFGFQAPAAYATLQRAIGTEGMVFDSELMKAHQKSPTWDISTDTRVREVFGDRDYTFAEMLYLRQVNQARALTLGVEWFRSRMPVCMGTLYWQLNDCWPVISWAAIDGDGRLKPLYYATKRFYADRLLTIHPKQDMLELSCINDHDAPWHGRIVLTMLNMLTGERLALGDRTLRAAPRTVQRFDLNTGTILRPPADRSAEVLIAEVEGSAHRAIWYYAPDKELRYPAPAFDAGLKRAGDEHRLTLRARSFLRDLAVFVDRLDPHATIDDQLVTLLPGETRTFVIRSKQELRRDSLTQPPVLRCMNRFGLANNPS